MEVTDELMLTWSNHQPTLLQEVATLRHKGGYADVTLACEGQLYCAHKFVLAMCSDYFRNIFNSSSVSSTSSNLVIVLKDVPCLAVEQLLDFMYTGEVAVDRACLPALIKTAENLQIRGLALPDHLPDTSFREAAKLPAQTGRHTPADKTKVSHREAGLYSDDSILSRSLEGYDTRGEHIHDGRANRNNSRLPVSSREGTSPPSKRKRLLDYSQSSAAPADTPSPVGTPRKSSVSSPGLGFPALSSPVPSSLVSGGAALPTPPSHSSPLTVPSSKLCVQQAAAGRMDTSSPRFPQSRSEPTTPVTQAAPLPSSPLNFRAGQCLAPSSQALPCLDHSSTPGHCVLPSATLAASSGTGLPLPEDVEIKREADDTTVCDLRNSSIDPSRDGAELKEEPPGDEMDVGSSEMRADDEGWLGASVADGAGSLIADASEDDAAAHSDSDVAGDAGGHKARLRVRSSLELYHSNLSAEAAKLGSFDKPRVSQSDVSRPVVSELFLTPYVSVTPVCKSSPSAPSGSVAVPQITITRSFSSPDGLKIGELGLVSRPASGPSCSNTVEVGLQTTRTTSESLQSKSLTIPNSSQNAGLNFGASSTFFTSQSTSSTAQATESVTAHASLPVILEVTSVSRSSVSASLDGDSSSARLCQTSDAGGGSAAPPNLVCTSPAQHVAAPRGLYQRSASGGSLITAAPRLYHCVACPYSAMHWESVRRHAWRQHKHDMTDHPTE